MISSGICGPTFVARGCENEHRPWQYGGNCMSQRRVTNGRRYSKEGGGMLITPFLGRHRL